MHKTYSKLKGFNIYKFWFNGEPENDRFIFDTQAGGDLLNPYIVYMGCGFGCGESNGYVKDFGIGQPVNTNVDLCFCLSEVDWKE